MKKNPPKGLQRLALATIGLGLFATSGHAIGQCSSTHSSDYGSANDKTATTKCFYKAYGNDRTVGLRVDIDQDRIFAEPSLFQNTFKTTPTYQEENLVANKIANKGYIKKETCKDTPPTSGLYYTDFESSSTYCSYFVWSDFMITIQADTQSSVSDDLVNIQGNYVSLNDAPVITQGSSVDVNMSEDAIPTPFSLDLNATDAEGDTITWSIDSNPNNGDASVSDTPTGQTQAISYTPNENFNGDDSFVVKASGGGESTITVNVTIEPVNDAPQITSTPITKATTDSQYSYALSATDMEGDDLNWSVGSKPDWLEFINPGGLKTFAGTGSNPTSDSGNYDSPDDTNATNADIRFFSSGNALHATDGKIYFSDTEEYGVRYIDENNKLQTFYAGDGEYTTLNVSAIQYDADTNTTYMGDYSDHKIVKSVNGGPLEDVATDIRWYVLSLLLDKENNKLYAGTRGAIFEIDLTNSDLTTNTKQIVGGSNGFHGGYSDTGVASTSEIKQASSMAFDNEGNLIFTDRYNDIVRKVDIQNDTIETIAGTQGSSSVSGDGGAATDATFGDPTGLVVHPNGKIFITERLGKTVRVIDTNGIIDEYATVPSSGFLSSLAISEDNKLYIGTGSQIFEMNTDVALSGTPTTDDIGVHDVNLTVSDGNKTTAHDFDITVQLDLSKLTPAYIESLQESEVANLYNLLAPEDFKQLSSESVASLFDNTTQTVLTNLSLDVKNALVFALSEDDFAQRKQEVADIHTNEERLTNLENLDLETVGALSAQRLEQVLSEVPAQDLVSIDSTRLVGVIDNVSDKVADINSTTLTKHISQLSPELFNQLDKASVANIFDAMSEQELTDLSLDVKNALVFALSEDDFAQRKQEVADIHTNEERLTNLENLDLETVGALSAQRLEQVLSEVPAQDLVSIDSTRLVGVIDNVSDKVADINSTTLTKHISQLSPELFNQLDKASVANIFDAMSEQELTDLSLDVKNALVFALSEDDFAQRKQEVADIHTNEERLTNLANLDLETVGALSAQRLEQVLSEVPAQDLVSIDSTRLVGVIDNVSDKVADINSTTLTKHISQLSPELFNQLDKASVANIFDAMSEQELTDLSLDVKNALVFALSEDDFAQRKQEVADIHTNEERLTNLANLDLETVGALSAQRLEQVLSEVPAQDLVSIDSTRLVGVIDNVSDKVADINSTTLTKHISQLSPELFNQLDKASVANIFDAMSEQELTDLSLDVKNALVFALSEDDFAQRKQEVADIHTNEERLTNLANLDLTQIGSLSAQRLEQVLSEVPAQDLVSIDSTRLVGVIDNVSDKVADINSTTLTKHISQLSPELFNQLDKASVANIFDAMSEQELTDLSLDVKNALVFALSEDDFAQRKQEVADIHTNEERLTNLANLDLTQIGSLSAQRLEQVLSEVPAQDLVNIQSDRLVEVIDNVSDKVADINSTTLTKHISQLSPELFNQLDKASVANIFDAMSEQELTDLSLDVKNALVFALSEDDFAQRKQEVADIHTNEERLTNLANLDLETVGALSAQRLEQVLSEVPAQDLVSIDSTRLVGVIDNVSNKVADINSTTLTKHISKLSPELFNQLDKASVANIFDAMSEQELTDLSLDVKNALVFALSEDDFAQRKQEVADIHTNQERLTNLENLDLTQIGSLSAQRLEQVLIQLPAEDLVSIESTRLAGVIDAISNTLEEMDSTVVSKHVSQLPNEVIDLLDTSSIVYEMNQGVPKTAPTKEGYVFMGWNSTTDETTGYVTYEPEFNFIPTLQLTSESIIVLEKDFDEHNISFNVYDGEGEQLIVKIKSDNNGIIDLEPQWNGTLTLADYNEDQNQTLTLKQNDSNSTGTATLDFIISDGISKIDKSIEVQITNSIQKIGNVTITSDIADANTTDDNKTISFKKDNNVTSTVKVNDNNETDHNVTVKSSNGESISTRASSKLKGSIVSLLDDGSVRTKATVADSTITVDGKTDGTAEHKVSKNGVESKATSKVKGAKTVIDTNGNVDTSVDTKKQLTSGRKFEAVAVTGSDGKTETKFREVDGTTEYNPDPTLATGEKFPVGSEVEITEDSNNTIHIQTKTPKLTEPKQFKIK